MRVDLDIYFQKAIELIGIVFLIYSVIFFLDEIWYWVIFALISIILYVLLPSFKEDKQRGKK